MLAFVPVCSCIVSLVVRFMCIYMWWYFTRLFALSHSLCALSNYDKTKRISQSTANTMISVYVIFSDQLRYVLTWYKIGHHSPGRKCNTSSSASKRHKARVPAGVYVLAGWVCRSRLDWFVWFHRATALKQQLGIYICGIFQTPMISNWPKAGHNSW